MRHPAVLLPLPEAATLADVSVTQINRVLDDDILPASLYTRGANRRLHEVACPLVSFYYGSRDGLAPNLCRKVIVVLTERYGWAPALDGLINKDWRVETEYPAFPVVDVLPFVRLVSTRHEKLAKARNLIVEDPAILGGTPVIRGTRIPVHDIAAVAGNPATRDEVLEHYPALDREKVELAVFYARAFPQPGRPRRSRLLERGKLKSSRTVKTARPA